MEKVVEHNNLGDEGIEYRMRFKDHTPSKGGAYPSVSLASETKGNSCAQCVYVQCYAVSKILHIRYPALACRRNEDTPGAGAL